MRGAILSPGLQSDKCGLSLCLVVFVNLQLLHQTLIRRSLDLPYTEFR